MPEFPRLEGEQKTDVLVIGGGMAGLLTAYYLQQAGISCIVLEAETIGGGVTGDTTAKVTAQHGLIYSRIKKRLGLDAAQLYYETQQAAIAEYRTLSRRFPCEFQEETAYLYARQGAAALEEEYAVYRDMAAPATLETALPLPFPITAALALPGQAQIHPLHLLAALAKELKVFEHSRVLALEKNKAITTHGSVRAERIVVATHFPFLRFRGYYFIKQYQHRSYVLALQGAPECSGMYLDIAPGGLSIRQAGPYLILGGGGHRTGKPGDGWAPLHRFVAETYPAASIAAQWAAQDCMTLDGMPYIGRLDSHRENLYVATGFNKWGMTGAMVSAMLLRDSFLGKKTAASELFSPQRPLCWPQVGKNLGSAASGMLRFGKRCPHLGCALRWNPNERSWDCSCHGSRFSESGHVLDGPANRDIHP